VPKTGAERSGDRYSAGWQRDGVHAGRPASQASRFFSVKSLHDLLQGQPGLCGQGPRAQTPRGFTGAQTRPVCWPRNGTATVRPQGPRCPPVRTPGSLAESAASQLGHGRWPGVAPPPYVGARLWPERLHRCSTRARRTRRAQKSEWADVEAGRHGIGRFPGERRPQSGSRVVRGRALAVIAGRTDTAEGGRAARVRSPGRGNRATVGAARIRQTGPSLGSNDLCLRQLDLLGLEHGFHAFDTSFAAESRHLHATEGGGEAGARGVDGDGAALNP
jgi:hypothetical protein